MHLSRIHIGINSEVKYRGQKRHLIFLDYDGVSRKDAREDVVRLQNKYDLPAFDFLKSSNKRCHYHAICFCLAPKLIMKNVVYDSNCDDKFKMFLAHHGYATLRVTKKKNNIKHLETILSEKKYPKFCISAYARNSYFKILNSKAGNIKMLVW